jgi:hypothetical protein
MLNVTQDMIQVFMDMEHVSWGMLSIPHVIKFKMAAFTKLTKRSTTALNRFINPANMGLDTKIKSICAVQTEI